MKIIQKIWLSFTFLLFYLSRVIRANIQIAYDILTPQLYIKPVFYDVPLTLHSRNEILLFINLVTMTPGSMSVDINEEKKTLNVHILYDKGIDEFRKEMQDLQSRIQKLFSL
jgi:multicomponent Na+:H+ antiporter subunit E